MSSGTRAPADRIGSGPIEPDEQIPVLVVGGSLVGLSLSLFLSRLGVEHLVVERHPGTAIHPRAAMLLQRTIETFRTAGIQDEVLEASQKEFEQDGAIVSVESLGGKELDWYFRNVNDGVEHLSPSPRLFVTQIGLEPVIKQRAAELGARLEYSSEVTSLDASADGVTAVVRARESGAERTVRAQYAVAADGAHSPVRERLGIRMTGRGSFSESVTIYFRADCSELIGDRNLSVIYVFHPRQIGFFRFSLDRQSGFLVVNSAADENGVMSPRLWDDTSESRCAAWVREALGASDDLAIEVENVQRWNAQADVAERFRAGRVFLAGDATHVMPPTGGYGGNTGVHDAFNLAWKLAFVLDGRGAPGLLDTYEAERQPVARLTVEQAYARYVLRLDKSLGTEDLAPIVEDALIDLGYRLRSAGIVREPDDDDADWEDPRSPTGRPGFRAPHVELVRDGSPLSTLDLTGTSFVLFTGADGGAWVEGAAVVANERGVPLDPYRVGADLEDRSGAFFSSYGIDPTGASLVRPDGHVVWRARTAVEDPRAALTDALALALCR
jgi:2-polyprenyl-6-methoxyphenol hydroxylase-like FAD-dependent oxidoreductase